MGWFVDVEFSDVSGVKSFGPVSGQNEAEALLLALAARENVTTATIVRR